MRRRQFLSAVVLATAGLAGCSGGSGDGNGSNGNNTSNESGGTAVSGGTPLASDTATDTEAATATETTAPADTQATTEISTESTTTTEGNAQTQVMTEAPTTTAGNESGGLPDAPGNGTPGTPTGEFTTSAASTPMDADTFVETLEGRLDEKDLMTGYVINTRADEQAVELTYVASEDNQRERLEAFAESFVETVRRTGGTGGWSLDMTVQTGAERDVWYMWQVKDEWAVQRLTGEISRGEFYSKIEETTTTPSE